MFKFLVIVLLCIIAFDVMSADINVLTVHVVAPVERSFVAVRINSFYEIYRLPFIVGTHYWSW